MVLLVSGHSNKRLLKPHIVLATSKWCGKAFLGGACTSARPSFTSKLLVLFSTGILWRYSLLCIYPIPLEKLVPGRCTLTWSSHRLPVPELFARCSKIAKSGQPSCPTFLWQKFGWLAGLAVLWRKSGRLVRMLTKSFARWWALRSPKPVVSGCKFLWHFESWWPT